MVLQELSLLQDRVPAFNSARAVATIEQELGMPLTSAFRTFDREPIAAASLGQVSTALCVKGRLSEVSVLMEMLEPPAVPLGRFLCSYSSLQVVSHALGPPSRMPWGRAGPQGSAAQRGASGGESAAPRPAEAV